MIIVFNALPIILANSIAGSATPINSRAATAAAETVNVVEWIIQVDC